MHGRGEGEEVAGVRGKPMSGKIVVPEGMMKAALSRVMDMDLRFKMGSQESYEACVEAALRWLSDNPIVPSEDQLQAMREHLLPDMPKGAEHFTSDDLRRGAIEWQRRMFLREK